MSTDRTITSQADIDVNSVHDVQVARLDADMFTADDIDGVTEGLSGSGNLNYLVLQSQQTNESSHNINPFDITGSNADGLAGVGSALSSGAPAALANGGYAGPYAFASDLSDALGLLNVSGPESGDPSFGVGEGQGWGASGNIGSISAADFRARFTNGEDNTFNFFNSQTGNDGNDGSSGNDGNPGTTGQNGSPGTPGQDGNDGRDGRDGETPGGPDDDDDYDLVVDVISDIVDVDLDVILDPIEDILGDIDIDVDAILGDILDFDDGILPNPTVILDAIVGGVDILDQLQVDVILTPVNNLLDGVIGTVNPILGGLLPFIPDPLDLLGNFNSDGDTDLVLGVDLGLPDLLGLGGLGALGAHIPLDPLEMLLGDIDMNLDVSSALQDLLSGGLTVPVIDIGLLSDGEFLPGLDILLGTDTLLGDVLGTVGDLDGILTPGGDLTDTVDNLLGTVGNVLDADNLVGDLLGGDVIGNLTGGLLDGLLGGGDGNPGGGADDIDLSVDTGVAISDMLLDQVDLDVVLDPLENIIGDIDIGVNLNTDIVNEVLSGDIEGAAEELFGAVSNLITLDLDLFNPGEGQDSPLNIVTGDILGEALDEVLPGAGGIVEDLVDSILDGGDGGNPVGIVEDLVGGLLGGDQGDQPGGIVEDILGGIIGGDGDGNPGDIVGDLVDGILGGSDEGSPVGIVEDIVGGIIGGGDGGNPGDIVGDLLGGILGGGQPGDGGEDDIDLSVDTGFAVGDVILDQVDLDATLDPLENIIGDIDIGLNLNTDIVNEVLSGDIEGAAEELFGAVSNLITLDLDLFNPGEGQDSPLDIVTGDILDEALNEVLPGAGDIVGDLVGGIIGGGQPDDGGEDDIDLSVDTGFAIGDIVLDQVDLESTLDPLESIIGDIDIAVDLNTDIVNEVLSGDLGGAVEETLETVQNLIQVDIDLLNPGGGQDSPPDLQVGDILGNIGDILGGGLPENGMSWPEATVDDALGGIGDTLGGVVEGALGAVLPEPDGIVSDGLNLINDIVTGGGGGGGGLLGGLGGGLGGLFK